MWIMLGLIVGLIAVASLAVIIWLASRREHPSRAEMTGEELFTLGVVFTGAGVALSVSVGPAMVGMLAVGIVFMVLGARKRRRQG